MEQPTVYLAGPEVFLINAIEIGKRLKQIAQEEGLIALFPLDAEMKKMDSWDKAQKRKAIAKANRGLIEKSDGVIANLTPFRGPSADPGTVWECAYGYGRGRRVIGYSTDKKAYIERIEHGGVFEGQILDNKGMTIEDFDGHDNLMIEEALDDWVFDKNLESAFRRACQNMRTLLKKPMKLRPVKECEKGSTSGGLYVWNGREYSHQLQRERSTSDARQEAE